MVEYELIAGERRLRASKLAGLTQVPVIIKSGEEDSRVKLELAIIENLQREDLNPIDRARAFDKLIKEFSFKHSQVAKKMGKSREYVSNSVRLLTLPEEIINAISAGEIKEGHARPIMMLNDRPEEQITLFKEITFKKLTVREAEAIARRVASDRVRKKEKIIDPEVIELEKQMAQSLGTRVQIERRDVGGKVTIDFFSTDDLKKIMDLINSNTFKNPNEMLNSFISSTQNQNGNQPNDEGAMLNTQDNIEDIPGGLEGNEAPDYQDNHSDNPDQADGSVEQDVKEEDEEEDLYSVRNFSI